jgi:hypothetical protein
MTLIGKSKPLKHRGREAAEEKKDREKGKPKPYRGSTRMNADRKHPRFLPLINTDSTDRENQNL